MMELDLKKKITETLEDIKQLMPYDDCFQYHFVENNELPLLKRKLETFGDNDNTQDISEENIQNEFYELIKQYFGEVYKDIKPYDLLHRRQIILNDENESGSGELHREFDSYMDKFKYNIIYYYKIKNCDLEKSGTGIFFTTKYGESVYKILPAYEGLIICLRDMCMYHHTPIIKPINPYKPIYRTLIRMYIGSNTFEETYEKLGDTQQMQKILNVNDLEEKNLTYDEIDFLKPYTKGGSFYKYKYLKYKTKYFDNLYFR